MHRWLFPVANASRFERIYFFRSTRTAYNEMFLDSVANDWTPIAMFAFIHELMCTDWLAGSDGMSRRKVDDNAMCDIFDEFDVHRHSGPMPKTGPQRFECSRLFIPFLASQMVDHELIGNIKINEMEEIANKEELSRDNLAATVFTFKVHHRVECGRLHWFDSSAETSNCVKNKIKIENTINCL